MGALVLLHVVLARKGFVAGRAEDVLLPGVLLAVARGVAGRREGVRAPVPDRVRARVLLLDRFDRRVGRRGHGRRGRPRWRDHRRRQGLGRREGHGGIRVGIGESGLQRLERGSRRGVARLHLQLVHPLGGRHLVVGLHRRVGLGRHRRVPQSRGRAMMITIVRRLGFVLVERVEMIVGCHRGWRGAAFEGGQGVDVRELRRRRRHAGREGNTG